MKFLNVKLFAEMKKCSRQTVYNAERVGEIDIDRSTGFPVIYLTEKNLKWKPEPIGRPKKVIMRIS
jgi:hypothetical protein